MRPTRKLGLLALLCAMALSGGLGVPSPARAAPEDPIFVYVPIPPPTPFAPQLPPPNAYLSGPCGLAVDSVGNFYVSDYYHDVVDVFAPNDPDYTNPSDNGAGYITQLDGVDPIDGPCHPAVAADGTLYVNDYHRAVQRHTPSIFPPVFVTGYGPATLLTTLDDDHPTGVDIDSVSGDVYVDQRTYVSVYDSSGTPVLDGPDPLQIGIGTLEDGYDVAVSGYAGTLGYVYVPDAADDTVKVYDPAIDTVNPVATIDGSATPAGEFVSLRDSAVAVDSATGEVYVLDNLQPEYTEEPEGIVHVFDSAGSYEGHLKFKVVHGEPSGLAVDNSGGATQGRVYVTSGNTVRAGIYAYPPDAATTDPADSPSAPASLATESPQPTQPSGSVPSSTTSALASVADPDEPGIAGETTSVPRTSTSASGSLSLARGRILRVKARGRLAPRFLLQRPICRFPGFRSASAGRVLRSCHSALLGRGRFLARVFLRGGEPRLSRGRFLVFNARRRGRPLLLAKAYAPKWLAGSPMSVFVLKRHRYRFIAR